MVVGKGSSIPIPIVGYIFFSLSTLLYFIGYVLWQKSLLYYPKSINSMGVQLTPKNLRLLRSSDYTFSAVLGILATILGIASFFVPALGAFSAIAYFMSNSFWCRAERDVTKEIQIISCTQAEKESQMLYYSYSKFATVASFIMAVDLLLPLFIAAPTLGLLPVALPIIAFVVSVIGFTQLGRSVKTSSNQKKQEQVFHCRDSSHSHMTKLGLKKEKELETEHAEDNKTKHDDKKSSTDTIEPHTGSPEVTENHTPVTMNL